MSHVVALQVAGVRLDVHLPDAALAQVLARRYAGFPAHDAPALHVDVAGEPRERAGNVCGLVVERNGRLHLMEHESLGYLDRAARRGELAPHPSMMGVDMLLRAEITLQALQCGGLALHAASVELRGGTHVFMGPSGAGKSTLARKLQEEGGRVLSDEMTILRPSSSGWLAYGTPYRFGSAEPSPVTSLWLLRKGADVVVEAVNRATALRHLITNVSLPIRGDAQVRAAADNAAKLAGSIPCRLLQSALHSRVRSAVEEAA